MVVLVVISCSIWEWNRACSDWYFPKDIIDLVFHRCYSGLWFPTGIPEHRHIQGGRQQLRSTRVSVAIGTNNPPRCHLVCSLFYSFELIWCIPQELCITWFQFWPSSDRLLLPVMPPMAYWHLFTRCCRQLPLVSMKVQGTPFSTKESMLPIVGQWGTKSLARTCFCDYPRYCTTINSISGPNTGGHWKNWNLQLSQILPSILYQV